MFELGQKMPESFDLQIGQAARQYMDALKTENAQTAKSAAFVFRGILNQSAPPPSHCVNFEDVTNEAALRILADTDLVKRAFDYVSGAHGPSFVEAGKLLLEGFAHHAPGPLCASSFVCKQMEKHADCPNLKDVGEILRTHQFFSSSPVALSFSTAHL